MSASDDEDIVSVSARGAVLRARDTPESVGVVIKASGAGLVANVVVSVDDIAFGHSCDCHSSVSLLVARSATLRAVHASFIDRVIELVA